MTSLLVNEIARLVNEHNVDVEDVRLAAEESGNGNYFLRIFPAPQPGSAIVQNNP
jgi:UDP-N-acetyl-D-mannosaminuronate dehydrogenase